MPELDWGLPDPQRQGEFYDSVPTKRLVAWLFDTVLILCLCAILIPFTAFTALFYLPFFYVVVGLAYRFVTIARKSATPGMRLTAIELRTRDGERFDAAHAFLHTLGYSVSMGFVLPQVISVAMMMTDARGRGLTDMVLGTAAINRPA